MSTYVVILAGGAGTRFWPSGRRARPKQLLKITGPRTMLAATLERCAALAPPERTFVVTNRLQVEATRRECPELPPDQVVAEPSMRNTAAAIGLAALLVRRREPEAVMIVLPADHHIEPLDAFLACYRAAARRAAEADALITIGIRPTGPATGYGYIESGERIAEVDGFPVHRVSSFKEKPTVRRAAEFVASERYFWNAGTFAWRASTLRRAFAEHLPGHDALLGEIAERLDAGDELPADVYDRFERVPVDIGILEKAGNVEVIPANFRWDDVGSWLAIDRLNPRDERGNVVRGHHVGLDTQHCIIYGKDRLIATIGVEDLIIVQTDDATLVCPKDRAEEVRALVAKLKEEGLDRYL